MWARYMYAAAKGHPNLEIPWIQPEGVRKDDRGDHTKGKILEMPLVYLRPPKKPEDAP